MKINQILTESTTRLDPKCWSGKKIGNPKTKMKDGVRVNNCVPKEDVSEGAIKRAMHDDADQMTLAQFTSKYGNDDWVKEFWNNINDISENFSREYDDEAGMAYTNLRTIIRAAEGLLDTIDDNENLPEWVQEKIAKVEDLIVTSWDYLISQEEQGINPEVSEASKSPAWKRKEGKNKSGGLNKKGVASYRRENPGSKLQTAVTKKPSELKPGSKDAKRRKSFCARMSGVKGPMKDDNGKPTRKSLALKKWNC